jgi:tetratricopeptide (TPR) repeat protein
MEFDVFISYPHQDKATADAVCAKLEAAGVRCWIAPRDVPPGSDWAASIVAAIDQCRAMVLIFSSSANKSKQIHREVQQAFEKEKPVLPFRIENVVPEKSLAYYMGPVHWLDAVTPPIELHFHNLVQSTIGLVRKPGQSERKSATEAVSPGRAVAKPATPEAFQRRGFAFQGRGEWERAIQEFNEALRLNPDYALCYQNRGTSYAMLGDDERAIRDYREAVRLDPGDPYAHAQLGNSYLAVGKYEAGVECLNEALRLNPHIAGFYRARGSLYQAQRKYERASEDYDNALRLNPRDPLTYMHRGHMYLRCKDWDRALNDYDQALSLRPKDAQALYERGMAKRGMGDELGAQADIAAAVALNPDVGLK